LRASRQLQLCGQMSPCCETFPLRRSRGDNATLRPVSIASRRLDGKFPAVVLIRSSDANAADVVLSNDAQQKRHQPSKMHLQNAMTPLISFRRKNPHKFAAGSIAERTHEIAGRKRNRAVCAIQRKVKLRAARCPRRPWTCSPPPSQARDGRGALSSG